LRLLVDILEISRKVNEATSQRVNEVTGASLTCYSLLIASFPYHAAFSASSVLVWGVFQRSIAVLSVLGDGTAVRPERQVTVYSPFPLAGKGESFFELLYKSLKF